YSDNDIINRNPSTSVIKDVYERCNNIMMVIHGSGLDARGVVLPKPSYHSSVSTALRGAVGKTEAGTIPILEEVLKHPRGDGAIPFPFLSQAERCLKATLKLLMYSRSVNETMSRSAVGNFVDVKSSKLNRLQQASTTRPYLLEYKS